MTIPAEFTRCWFGIGEISKAEIDNVVRLEVQGCRAEGSECDLHVTTCADDVAQFWSVYIRVADSIDDFWGAYCIADCPDKDLALTYARLLGKAHEWPVWDRTK